MVLFGLVDYLAASHELDSDFTAEVLVNGRSVGQRHFTSADALSGASLSVDVDCRTRYSREATVCRSSGAAATAACTGRRAAATTRPTKKDFQAGTMSLNLTRDYYKLQPMQKDGKIVYCAAAAERHGAGGRCAGRA